MNNEILAEMANHKWIMEPNALRAYFESVSKLSLTNLAAVAVEMPKTKLNVANGIARINITGVLLNKVPGWARLWGLNATGYDEITEQVNMAASDKSVSAIELYIDSPGGMVAGEIEAADAIYNARVLKPVTAVVGNLAASAAYWLASQAQSISAGRTAEIGSIGVFSVYYDWSGFDEKTGIKTVVIRSGEHKGMGYDKITDAQVAAVQEIIDGLANQFVSSVSKGRNKTEDEISKLATGRLWLAGPAVELGLIDEVTSSEQNNNTTNMKGTKNMDNVTTTAITAEQVKAAEDTAKKQSAADEKKRFADLKAAFPKDLDFAVAQFEAGSTVTEAKANYVPVLQARIDAKEAAGEEPIKSGDSKSQGEGSSFIAEGKKMAKDLNIPLGQAYKKLAKEQPELHAEYRRSIGVIQ